MLVLNSTLMAAVMELRAQGTYKIPCTVLIDGRAVAGLLGPRSVGKDGFWHGLVHVIVENVRREVEIGTVSVEGETLAQIEATAAQLGAVGTRRVRSISDESEADIEARLVENARLLIKRSGKRRNPITGRYAGHHCEKAGR